MGNRKLHIIIILILLLSILAGCTSQKTAHNPKAGEGIIDLSQFEFKDGVVRLDGEWEFYWNQLLVPDEPESVAVTEYIQVPGSWNKNIGNIEQSGNGYGTYRLVFIAEDNIRLAFKMPRILTAYDLWVNGELICEAGQVGKTRDTMTPQYLPKIAFFEALKGQNEILIHVSNFNHRSGGILESITLGSEKQIENLRYRSIARECILFGSLIFIAVYHLALYFYRIKNRSALYFGLFCLMIGIRTFLVGERFFIYLFPNFNWEIAHKIQTNSFYLVVPLVLMFFMSFFPKYFNIKMVRISQILGAAFGLLVLLTPVRIFTQLNPIYQIWTGIVIIYIIGTLIRIMIHKEKDIWIIIIGSLALLLTSASDIIFLSVWLNDNNHELLRTIFRVENLSSYGQLIFAFTNSLMLARRFSDSLEHEEILTSKLIEINVNLDELVFQRTKDLEESNKKVEQQKLELVKANQALEKLSLKDPLTGVWNRRKYIQTIEMEWSRCLRHQRPLALLILDIDYFKEFNDFYGHINGDECLIKVGETLKKSLSRSSDLVARYGGDEFVVLLTEGSKKDAVYIANILQQRIEGLKIPHKKSKISDYVTISIGAAFMIPDKDSSHENLLEAADKALYKAKESGRNQVKFTDE